MRFGTAMQMQNGGRSDPAISLGNSAIRASSPRTRTLPLPSAFRALRYSAGWITSTKSASPWGIPFIPAMNTFLPREGHGGRGTTLSMGTAPRTGVPPDHGAGGAHPPRMSRPPGAPTDPACGRGFAPPSCPRVWNRVPSVFIFSSFVSNRDASSRSPHGLLLPSAPSQERLSSPRPAMDGTPGSRASIAGSRESPVNLPSSGLAPSSPGASCPPGGSEARPGIPKGPRVQSPPPGGEDRRPGEGDRCLFQRPFEGDDARAAPRESRRKFRRPGRTSPTSRSEGRPGRGRREWLRGGEGPISLQPGPRGAGGTGARLRGPARREARGRVASSPGPCPAFWSVRFRGMKREATMVTRRNAGLSG